MEHEQAQKEADSFNQCMTLTSETHWHTDFLLNNEHVRTHKSRILVDVAELTVLVCRSTMWDQILCVFTLYFL